MWIEPILAPSTDTKNESVVRDVGSIGCSSLRQSTFDEFV